MNCNRWRLTIKKIKWAAPAYLLIYFPPWKKKIELYSGTLCAANNNKYSNNTSGSANNNKYSNNICIISANKRTAAVSSVLPSPSSLFPFCCWKIWNGRGRAKKWGKKKIFHQDYFGESR